MNSLRLDIDMTDTCGDVFVKFVLFIVFLFGLFLIYIKLLTLEKPILIFHFYK